MARIKSLTLQNFRNFSAQNFDFEARNILFCGANGVGKTNILEAITLIGRGNNLRSDKLDQMVKISNQINNDQTTNLNQQNQRLNPETTTISFDNLGFSVKCELCDADFIDKIEARYHQNTNKKSLLINGEAITGNKRADFKQYLPNCILLNPALEQLFISDKANRRDYLDKIVCDLDLSHQTRLSSYEKLLRERLNFLQQSNFFPKKTQIGFNENADFASNNFIKNAANNLNQRQNSWLEILENQIAEIGVAIAAARLEAIDFFNRAIASFESEFPAIILQVFGEIEEMIIRGSVLQAEEHFRQKLGENRKIDILQNRTTFGVHRGDFDAVFKPKNLPATICSTGEQKAAMISITLARAKISSAYKSLPTILLFDEAASHLDFKRKEQFFEEVFQTNLQSFFTATSVDLIPEKFVDQLQIQLL